MNNRASIGFSAVVWPSVIGILLAIPGRAEDAHGPATGVNIAAPAPAATSAAAPMPAYKTYMYYGDRYRDPFIALNGDIRNDLGSADRPPQVTSLVLKGIVQDARSRMALLNSGVNSYILRG